MHVYLLQALHAPARTCWRAVTQDHGCEERERQQEGPQRPRLLPPVRWGPAHGAAHALVRLWTKCVCVCVCTACMSTSPYPQRRSGAVQRQGADVAGGQAGRSQGLTDHLLWGEGGRQREGGRVKMPWVGIVMGEL